MFKTKYRVIEHTEGNGKWLIQYKKWYSKQWLFHCGYYPHERWAKNMLELGYHKWFSHHTIFCMDPSGWVERNEIF